MVSGYPDQALAQTRIALGMARDLGAPLLQAHVLGHTAVIHQFRREVSPAMEQAKATMRLAAERGFSLWLAHATILRGWARAMQEPGAGIDEIARGLGAWRLNSQHPGQVYFLSLLAEAHGRAGDAKAGLEAVTEALALVERHGLRMYAAELYRLKGELLASVPLAPRGDVETCFRRALEIAARAPDRWSSGLP